MFNLISHSHNWLPFAMCWTQTGFYGVEKSNRFLQCGANLSWLRIAIFRCRECKENTNKNSKSTQKPPSKSILKAYSQCNAVLLCCNIIQIVLAHQIIWKALRDERTHSHTQPINALNIINIKLTITLASILFAFLCTYKWQNGIGIASTSKKKILDRFVGWLIFNPH